MFLQTGIQWIANAQGLIRVLIGLFSLDLIVLSLALAHEPHCDLEQSHFHFPKFQIGLAAKSESVSCLVFSSDGCRLYGGGSDKTIGEVNISTRARVRQIGTHEGWVLSLAVAPNGQTIASAGKDRMIRLWDSSSGEQIAQLSGHDDTILSVVFAPDGKMLASAGLDKTIRLWEICTGKQVRQLHGHQDSVPTIAFSPDGRLLVSGSLDRTIRLWEVASGKQITSTYDLSTRGILTLAFSPAGKIIAGGCKDGTIRAWNASTLTERGRFNGHKSYVSTLAFAPDGRIIVTGGYDNTLRLWEVATSEEICQLGKEPGWLFSVAFAPDGRTVASSCANDRCVSMWDLASLFPNTKSGTIKVPELRQYWTSLAIDASPKAFETISRLVACPESTVLFLRQQMRPVVAPDLTRIARLINDLGDARFSVRQKAQVELEACGETIEQILKRSLGASKSTEQTKRISSLLQKISNAPEPLQALRAMQVLEAIATPDAEQIIRELAQGLPESRVTQEARATIQRMRDRRIPKN